MTDIDPEYFLDAEDASVADSIENSVENNDAFMFAAGAALGSMLAEDEQMEREFVQNELKGEPEKVPLSDRFEAKANKHSRPVVRWLNEVKNGTKKITDPITYTPEEMMKILEQEGLDEI
jgi:hypothetical protein